MPDSSNDNSANGFHANGASNGPVIRPPDGQRMARGVDLSSENTSNETEFPIEVVNEAEERTMELESQTTQEEVEAPLSYADDTPPYAPLGQSFEPESRDKEMGLIEHLAELRTRLIYCFLAVGLAMCITWNQTPRFEDWLGAPILKVLRERQVAGVPGTPGNNPLSMNPVLTDPTGGFSIYFQVAVISALILTMPFLLFQIWRFIEPALTNNERRYTLVLVPFSSSLFFMGAGLGYAVSPLFFQFFLAFLPTNVLPLWDYTQSITLLAKMLLVFGIAFQVPVITIFLNKTGLVSRNLLIEYWRHAVIVIFTVVAIITPTWDPITLTVCATPPCLLYILSIWLVKWL